MATKDKLQGGNTRGIWYEGAGNNKLSNRTKSTQKNLLRVDTTGSPPSSTQNPHGKVIADTGDGNQLMTSKVPATNTVPVQHGKVAIIPHGNTMHSTKKGLLKTKVISDYTRTVHVFPGLKSGALISLGKLCDDVYDMTINSRNLNIYKKVQHLMTGLHNRKKVCGNWNLTTQEIDLFIHPPPRVKT